MENENPPPKSPWRVAQGLGQSLALVVLALSLLSLLARQHRVFELMCHFRLQYAVCGLALLVAFALFRSWRWAVAALACLALNAGLIAPVYFAPESQPEPAASGGVAVRLLLANVRTGNRQSGKLIELLKREKPDAFACLEVDSRWLADLEAVKELYPYSIAKPQELGNFGIALFSREPLADAGIVIFGTGDLAPEKSDHSPLLADEAELPSLRATIERQGRRLQIVATHPLPPLGYFDERNLHLQILGKIVRGLDRPLALLGDLNCTMWSPYFADFLREAQLRNARDGFGILPSWPADLPHLRIPIDHCLVSSGLRVVSCRLGPDIGSDHLPLIIDLAM